MGEALKRPKQTNKQTNKKLCSYQCTTATAMSDPSIHRVRPGIEPVASWILVGFVSAEPQQELQKTQLLFNPSL